MTGYIGPKCHFWVFYWWCRKHTSGCTNLFFDSLFWWRVEHAMVANRSLPLELGNAIAHGASWVSKRQTDSHTWWRWRKGGRITSNFRFARRPGGGRFLAFFWRSECATQPLHSYSSQMWCQFADLGCGWSVWSPWAMPRQPFSFIIGGAHGPSMGPKRG